MIFDFFKLFVYILLKLVFYPELLCRLCDRSFGCKSHLTRHIGKIHVDSMGNECEICGKIFDKSSDLLSHTKLLHYETEYICNVCSKVCCSYLLGTSI